MCTSLLIFDADGRAYLGRGISTTAPCQLKFNTYDVNETGANAFTQFYQ